MNMTQQMARVPHFIIGGAPRSGTTFLAQALDRHPQVHMAKPFIPEPKVFFQSRVQGRDALHLYRDLYESAPAGAILGEKSSHYFEDADVCNRIKESLPGVKLIFLVREPVSRAFSNYLRTKANGFETLSFEDAVASEGRRADPFGPERYYVKPFNYLSRGKYDLYAENYLKAFGEQRVRFFRFEDIVNRPQDLLDSVQRFLGLTPVNTEVLFPGIINSSDAGAEKLDSQLDTRLREMMRPHVLRFSDLTGLDTKEWGYGTST